MSSFYFLPRFALRTGFLLAPIGAALAQVPVITAVIPMANARAAARTGPVAISFSQPLAAASAGALRVFSSQRGGQRTTTSPATITGNTLSFLPTAYPFMPGEAVQYTVTTDAINSNDGALAQPLVGQFTAATGGTGTGVFSSGSRIAVDGALTYPRCLAVGDLDGDGDLDLVATSDIPNVHTTSVRFNNGAGVFSGSQSLNIGGGHTITLADVDGDGDLDVLANYISAGTAGAVSIRLNDGSGTFSGSQEVSVGDNVTDMTLGDVDGDGDLDLLTANYCYPCAAGSLSIRTNNGGLFSNSYDITLAGHPNALAIGDIDGDGDLDLLAAQSGTNATVSIHLNNGRGTFSGNQTTVVSGADTMVLGDVDGDGDLDLISAGTSVVSVRLNNGNGAFSGSQNVPTNGYSMDVKLGDVDGDGDLDLLSTSHNNIMVSIFPNDGAGTFGSSQNVPMNGAHKMALGDVDGDGDLDLLVTNNAISGAVNLYLNGSTVLAAAQSQPAGEFVMSPNPAHGGAVLTGASPYAPLTIFDVLGRFVLTTKADATGKAHLTLPDELPNGIYLVRCGKQVQRLLVE